MKFALDNIICVKMPKLNCQGFELKFENNLQLLFPLHVSKLTSIIDIRKANIVWSSWKVNYQYMHATGFLSISCGGTTTYTDSSNISWVPDGEYVSTGNISTSSSGDPIRVFPDIEGRKCYRIPVNNASSLILVRAQFLYKNYDGSGKPPAFSVSLGTAITSTINLTTNDPWTEEFLWPVNKDTLSFCLHAIPEGGSPVISSLEVRPLPQGAYAIGIGDFPNKSLRKSYRINCGFANGSLRYVNHSALPPFDMYGLDDTFSF